MKIFSVFLALAAAALGGTPAFAQNIDLGGQPGSAPIPIQITASQGIEWKQTQQVVIATGSAKAVRGAVTVDADQLIAHYRKKAGATPAPASTTTQNATDPQDALNGGDTEIYQLDAVGHVHIFTATDNAYGDHAVYNMDAAVLVLTGSALKLTTPTDTVTAKNAIEYYPSQHKAVARGDALIVTNDGRSISADTITGYLDPEPTQPAAAVTAANQAKNAANADPLAQSGGALKRVEALGHVVIKTTTDTATGNSGVYLPKTGQARLGGNVHIIRGQNELTGSDALVNMKTGVATLLATPGGQVAGTIIPNSAPATGTTKPGAKKESK